MQTEALIGGFQKAPVDAAIAFRAAMTAMARPGTVQTVTGAAPPPPLSIAAGVLVLTLCDPDTGLVLTEPFNTPDIRNWVTFHTGAPIVGFEEAAFAIGHWSDLTPIDRYQIGTAEYPDRSATLIVEVPRLDGPGSALRGPGIRDVVHLPLPDAETMAQNALLYPLGLDFFLTCGDQLAALPRSTRIGEA